MGLFGFLFPRPFNGSINIQPDYKYVIKAAHWPDVPLCCMAWCRQQQFQCTPALLLADPASDPCGWGSPQGTTHAAEEPHAMSCSIAAGPGSLHGVLLPSLLLSGLANPFGRQRAGELSNGSGYDSRFGEAIFFFRAAAGLCVKLCEAVCWGFTSVPHLGSSKGTKPGENQGCVSEQLLPGGFCFKLLASSRVSRDPASSQRQLRWEGSGQALCDPNKARCRLSGWCPEAGGAEAVLAAPALGYLLRGSRGQRCQSPHGC